MSDAGLKADLVLVHGIFSALNSGFNKKRRDRIRSARGKAFATHADTLGVCSHEWLDGLQRPLANRMLARMRGTAPAVDAVEIISVDSESLHRVLGSNAGRALWREAAACEPYDLDPARSFVLMGSPRRLIAGSAGGQRLIWFGNGLSELSRAEFIAHYTTRHGPLVAGHARLIGLRRYQQVPDEQEEFCASLRQLGLGQATPPATFAELFMGAPSMGLSSLRAYRQATREIKADEKQHIDFARSMLLLPGV